jgi:nitroimidazol reductase NimA-like FMN-containing flavoprotein (pyridoxamine 5'-phosphate oxidase superfamily)
LGEAECRRLLAIEEVGRLAVAIPGAAPLVVPVNYRYDGAVLIFRTDVGQKLDALRQGLVSFQIDSVDKATQTGWSVLVQGVAKEIAPGDVPGMAVEPWAMGPKDHWIRIIPTSMTGRRIVEADEPNGRGYL